MLHKIPRFIRHRFEYLKNHQGFLKYFKNTSWLLAEKIVKIFAGLFIVIWVAKYLGPTNFGILNYVINFSLLFTTLATLGIDTIVIREIINNKNNTDTLMGSAFGLKLIGAVVALLAIIFVVQFTQNSESTKLFIIIATSTVFFHSFNVIDFFNQGNVISKYTALANSISLIISIIIKIILIFYDAPLNLFIYVIIFESFCLSLGLIYFYQYHLHHKISQWNFNWGVGKALLKDSWPLMFSSILITIYTKMDQIMITEMLGYEENGQYAAAVMISGAWSFIPMIVSASLFPMIASAKKQSSFLYNEVLQRMYQALIWLAIAIAIPTTFIADWIINLIFGKEYNQSSSVLIICIWANIFIFFGTIRSKWIILENLQKISFFFLFFGCITNIILNIILIPFLKIQGAAIATIISHLSATLIFPFFNNRTKPSVIMFGKALLLKGILYDRRVKQ